MSSAPMSLEADPGFWHELVKWLWALLLLPVATLWRRTENAVQKTELAEVVVRIEKAAEKHAEDDNRTRSEIREAQRTISDSLGRQGVLLARIEGQLAAMPKRRGD